MTDRDRAAPDIHKHRDHKITLTPAPGTCRATRNGRTLAQSNDVLVMQEASYDPVWYFPPGAVDAGTLTRTDHTSYCPFKGQASYWSAPGKSGDNIAWGYEDPIDEVLGIKGYLAFYADRVELTQD